MAQSKWNRTKEIFLAACEMATQERAVYVARECLDDADLLAEVTSLLAAMDSQTVDDQSSRESAAPPDRDIEDANRAIGPYRLIERIGEGGFGTVWLAEQRHPIARQVAIKSIKLGMDTRQVLARFEQEKQSLARMDHPNIARVYDAGTTENGKPYFVMELVQGKPILAYCNARRLSVRDRLRLFVDITNAVQHAHQKGIIHRDLKPSNVLVSEVDGKPHPKIIDFGISKAIESSAAERMTITGAEQMVGTPQYMSPEQADGSADIDTRADIYSLGVLLYELLTGFAPIELRNRTGTRHDLQRAILDTDFKAPSTRLRQESASMQAICVDRSSEPASLQRAIRGELDWIAMKCLEKDRTRRYESAGALADDIARHLAGEIVQAAPPSRAYRVSKFVRRHRTPVYSTLVLCALMVAGTLVYIRGINLERRKTVDALDLAERQRARATQQASVAEAVSRFQRDIFAAADPGGSFGDKVTVLQAMEVANNQLDEGALREQPMVEAAIRFMIGQTLSALSSYDQARANFLKSIELYSNTQPIDEPRLAASVNALGLVAKLQDRLPEAEEHYRRSLEIRQRTLAADDTELATSYNNLASLLQDTGRPEEAERLYLQTLKIRRANRENLLVAQTTNNLASLKLQTGKLDEGAALLEEALAMRKLYLRPDHPTIGQSLNNLAAARLAQGKLDEVGVLLRESLDMRRRGLPAGHPDIAVTLHNLARLYIRQEKWSEAEPALREALQIRVEKLGNEAGPTTRTAAALAEVFEKSGRPEEASKLRSTHRLPPAPIPVTAPATTQRG